MYFASNIAIFNLNNEDIRRTIIRLMQREGFKLANDDLIRQALQVPGQDLLPDVDERLMLRKLLISPIRNKWSIVYPSTGWFSEVQDLGVKLSKRLRDQVLVVLVDDTYGWGYELSQKGQVIDRFHTEPLNTPTLNEKSEYGLFQGAQQVLDSSEVGVEKQSVDILTLARLALPKLEDKVALKRYLLEKAQVDLLTPEQRDELEDKLDSILANLSLSISEQKDELAEKDLVSDPAILDKLLLPKSEQKTELEKYQGNPAIIANIFGVPEDKVVHCLKSENEAGGWSHDDMAGFFELLGIEDGDGTYQDLLMDTDDSWHHLIFARHMTAVELQWREKWKMDFPLAVPPLWLNKE